MSNVCLPGKKRSDTQLPRDPRLFSQHVQGLVSDGEEDIRKAAVRMEATSSVEVDHLRKEPFCPVAEEH